MSAPGPRSLIALGHQAQTGGHRHFDDAAKLLGVLERHQSRRRVPGVDFLLVELETTVVPLDEVAEPDAQVGAVRQLLSSRRTGRQGPGN